MIFGSISGDTNLHRDLRQVVGVPEGGGDVEPEVWRPLYHILSQSDGLKTERRKIFKQLKRMVSMKQ